MRRGKGAGARGALAAVLGTRERRCTHGHAPLRDPRIEPKTYFANERTFLNWMHMAIVTGTIASALLGLSGAGDGAGPAWTTSVISLVMLPVSIMIAVYALYTFYWRLTMIRRREVSFFDDKHGPLVLAGVIVFALAIIFIVSLLDFVQTFA